MNLFDAAYQALMTPDPDRKCVLAAALLEDWSQGRVDMEGAGSLVHPVEVPGRPERPELVSPLDVRHRGLGSLEGRAALIHALSHIEFNAINLALDAVYRFRDMPAEFYGDWLKVAAEEAYHFKLLRDYLAGMGYRYGDFTAHNGLWEMARKTSGDPLARMALVPRLLEARGLDVTPGIRAKLVAAGESGAGEILDIILRDEVGHVAIGNHWFSHLCAQRELLPAETFVGLLAEYDTPRPRPPFNREARVAAGFERDEIAWLESEL